MTAKQLIFILLLWASHVASAQDTIRILQHNMLYYGTNSSFCSSLNNPISLKNEAMTKIVRHTSPDIIALNEMGPQDFHHDLLLSNALNLAWPNRYARAGFSNINASTLVNELYYDQHKLGLKTRYGIYSAVRDADAYLLYHKPIGPTEDTVFILHVVTHLKAGSGTSDQQARALQSADIMAWLSNHSFRGNLILSGDFNMKNSGEQAWYNMTQYPDESVRFYDPVNAPGQWYGNWSFRMLHTQSSRTSTTGCGSGGGLDDRFDLIMLSQALMAGSAGLSYLQDSYTVIGQDGLRLNASITNPTNTLVPDSIAQALEDLSDHLPVMLSLVTTDPTRIHEIASPEPWLTAITAGNGQSGILARTAAHNLNLALYTLDGRLYWRGITSLNPGEVFWLPTQMLQGIYILRAAGPGISHLKILIP